MPWVKNPNEEDVYIPSIYSKDDLPTWEEVFRWYCIMQDNGWDYFSTNNCTKMNAYWNIPEELFLCSVCCNQLNKLLHEDGLINKPEFLNDLTHVLEDCELLKPGYKVLNMRFNPYFSDTVDINDKLIFSLRSNPTVDLLTRKDSEYTHAPMNEYKGLFGLSIIISTQNEREIDIIKIRTGSSMTWPKSSIVEIMLHDVNEYFSGKVGWKDIESDNSPAIKCPAGYDPAL